MKNFSIIHILLFVIMMLAYQCSVAQDYVVTTKNDTLRGSVKLINTGPEKKVQITDDQKKKTTISILQTKSFIVKGDTFLPVRSDKGYVFMKAIQQGYLSLYAFQLENQSSYDGRWLFRRDGKGMEVPNLSFKKMMVKFLHECPSVTENINNGTLSKKDLNQIIDQFNSCIDKNSEDVTVMVTNQKNTNTWNNLAEKVKAQPDFEGKNNALEMISEIKNKVAKAEKVPNFLTEGLKSALQSTDLKEDLELALKELN